MLIDTSKKNKRASISLETKINVLDRLHKGESTASLGRAFCPNEATIRTIKKNDAAIRKSVASGTKLFAKSSYTRDMIQGKMEKALIIWIEENNQKRILVDDKTIKYMALRFYKINDLESSSALHLSSDKM